MSALNLCYAKNSITDLTFNLEMETTLGDILPIDITNVDLLLTVKKNLNDADPGIYQKRKSVHEGPTTGVSVFQIPIGITGNDTGDYYWSLRAIDKVSGQVYPLLAGNLNISLEATQSYV